MRKREALGLAREAEAGQGPRSQSGPTADSTLIREVHSPHLRPRKWNLTAPAVSPGPPTGREPRREANPPEPRPGQAARFTPLAPGRTEQPAAAARLPNRPQTDSTAAPHLWRGNRDQSRRISGSAQREEAASPVPWAQPGSEARSNSGGKTGAAGAPPSTRCRYHPQ
ncbi:hypothetical protein NDU88_008333 [Pleurodeles waltl]|uniref:Uncharacterized protein n=1 Tax=Pleurodeles waltl TaxID=8319 RepID=A0AAV7QPL2_PLEWA|nr:hypothetical protein NDU88_008333 [Pleurodeles waltl]